MKHVMIVDDHEIVRRGLKEIFASAFPKMEASEATNSRDALELVMTQDLIAKMLGVVPDGVTDAVLHTPSRSGLPECWRGGV